MFGRSLRAALMLGLALPWSFAPGGARAHEPPVSSPSDTAWQRVFTEEFDGPALDGGRWTTCYWWDNKGCTNLGTNELQWYTPRNVSVSGGHLVLEARKEQVRGHKGRKFAFTSGIVTTGLYYRELPRRPRFEFQYGLVEIRAKPPAGKGLWSALWFLPSSRESVPEIDMMELLGDKPSELQTHFHYVDANGDVLDIGEGHPASDLTEDWHVYGVRWDTDEIVWYLDGKEIYRFSEKRFIPKEPMYLLINLAVGGNWPGAPGPQTRFPAQFLVDYVRIWQRPTR